MIKQKVAYKISILEKKKVKKLNLFKKLNSFRDNDDNSIDSQNRINKTGNETILEKS